MLQPRTIVTIADNSGPQSARLFYIRGDFNKNVKLLHGGVRDRVRMSVRTMRRFTSRRGGHTLRKTIYISMKRWGYIVRTRACCRYRGCATLRFFDNSCVIWWRNDRIRGRRTFGITTRVLAFKWLLSKFRFHV